MPGKCKSNARFPAIAIPTSLAHCLQKTIHLVQHTNNPKALGLYFHQMQTSLDTPQLDPIYPSHAIAPWARQNYWQSTYKYNLNCMVYNCIRNSHAPWLHLQQAGHSKIPSICHPQSKSYLQAKYVAIKYICHIYMKSYNM